MRYDPSRLTHLRQIARDRRAAYRAASDDRADAREKLRDLERDRQRIVMNFGENREPEALAALDRRIKTAKADLAAMDDRANELASASSIAGQTFQRALEHAQEAGLDLPDDLRPRDFGAAAQLPGGAS